MDNEPTSSQNTIPPHQPIVDPTPPISSSSSINSNQPVKTMNPKIAAFVILAVGLVALVGGYFIVQHSTIPKSYTITHGRVKSAFPAQGSTYDIQIDFTAQDNKQYSFISRVPAQSAIHDSVYFAGNNTIKVAYNPSNPGVGEKNVSDKATPAYGVIFIIIGGIFSVIGLISTLQQLLKRN